ncbi:MAG: 1-deoxy-D-xylulose-5-phosphate synthase [Thermaerobacter sp.]|nr:1-deoxy-D-xylulose-5-phosphate synthase [Thermaerobacter sp.]
MAPGDQLDGKDLGQCSDAELRQVCADIRHEIIDVVSRVGGHLAPSLGAVEIVVALHAVLHSPKDKLLFDVGHQAYAHKLLTGRRAIFQHLRQKGGASGYLRRDESEHDTFGAGHASTAISAALGVATARDVRKEDFAVAAIVGDGALTGGLAYEGLNNAGQLGTDLIIVLNDNSMSISPNVGAVSTYLTRLRSAPAFARLKHDVESALRAIPLVGRGAAEAAERMKDSVKHLLVPGQLFEELGVRYLGPIDGHDVGMLRTVLRRAREIGGPVLVHAVTEKGHGYEPAAADANKWHSTAPFEVETGQGKAARKSGTSWSETFGSIAVDLAKEDPRIVAVTAAMADGTGLVRFREVHPDRFFDVGIAEAHAVAFSAGMATQGLRPLCAIYSTFLQRAYDQLIHDIGIQRLPVVFCMDRAGLVGEDGATHQGLYDFAYLRAIPGYVVAAPRDEVDLEALLRLALQHDGPFAVRYPRGNCPGVQREAVPFGIGQGEWLRTGTHGALLAVGTMVQVALDAAQLLNAQGISLAVADARFVKPVDAEMVQRAADYRLIATLEEGTDQGGFGDAVLGELAARGYQGRFERFAVPDRYIEHASRQEQLEECGLTAPQIAKRLQQTLNVNQDAS